MSPVLIYWCPQGAWRGRVYPSWFWMTAIGTVNSFCPILSELCFVITNFKKSTNGRQKQIFFKAQKKKKKKPLALTEAPCISLSSPKGSEDPSELKMLRITKMGRKHHCWAAEKKDRLIMIFFSWQVNKLCYHIWIQKTQFNKRMDMTKWTEIMDLWRTWSNILKSHLIITFICDFK